MSEPKLQVVQAPENSGTPTIPLAQPTPQHTPQSPPQPTPQSYTQAIAQPTSSSHFVVRVAKTWIYLAAAALTIAFGYEPANRMLYDFLNFETTDDAEIAAPIATISAKVGGVATEVLFEDNARVHRGDVLVRLDTREYTAMVNLYRAEVGAAKATYDNAKANLDRSKYLFKRGYRPQQALDAAQAQYHESLGQYWVKRAQLDQARVNLEYATIKAPDDGFIGKRMIEPGMVLKPQQSITTFVDGRKRWVVANFKENQLAQIQPGSAVEIEIDAIKNRKFLGTVDSFSPASGGSLALIPPDNATGNFVKIIQRVPVKILFSPNAMAGFEDRLVPGISAYVKVKIRQDGRTN